MDQVMTATLTLPAPAAQVFAVLADPTAHPAIDGTGWVEKPIDPAPLTEAGQVFRMAMYHAKHPDGAYRMANKVLAFDPPRAIGWIPGQEKEDGTLEFGGWTWHYDLVPLGPSETEVTLTYDWSGVPQALLEHLNLPPFGPEHLTDSLSHLAALVTKAPAT